MSWGGLVLMDLQKQDPEAYLLNHYKYLQYHQKYFLAYNYILQEYQNLNEVLKEYYLV